MVVGERADVGDGFGDGRAEVRGYFDCENAVVGDSVDECQRSRQAENRFGQQRISGKLHAMIFSYFAAGELEIHDGDTVGRLQHQICFTRKP